MAALMEQTHRSLAIHGCLRCSTATRAGSSYAACGLTMLGPCGRAEAGSAMPPEIAPYNTYALRSETQTHAGDEYLATPALTSVHNSRGRNDSSMIRVPHAKGIVMCAAPSVVAACTSICRASAQARLSTDPLGILTIVQGTCWQAYDCPPTMRQARKLSKACLAYATV